MTAIKRPNRIKRVNIERDRVLGRARHFLMPQQTSLPHNIINVDTSRFFSFGYNHLP